MRTWFHLGRCEIGLTVLLLAAGSVRAAMPTFSEDFSKCDLGKVPDSFLVMDGQFAVREEDGNRFLELPGAPLDTYAVLFGPASKENWGAQARFSGSGKGRKYPVFGISINGFGGYRLSVSPAKKAMELFKGDVLETSAPFEWDSHSWTQLRIRLLKKGSTWLIQGKAWKDGAAEPEAWPISWEEPDDPLPGRAAVWGMPYAGTPIRFDDFKVAASGG